MSNQKTMEVGEQDARWELAVDDVTGKKYWHGFASGDKDDTNFDLEQPMVLDPKYFDEGYIIKGFNPPSAQPNQTP